MTRKNVTRMDLAEAVYEKVGLSRVEATDLVGQVIEGISSALAAGENVRLSGFGSFIVRKQGQRPGRNPKTGAAVLIEPRQVVAFNPSQILKAHVSGGKDRPCLANSPLNRQKRLGL